MRVARFSLSRHLMLCERNYSLLMRILRHCKQDGTGVEWELPAQLGPSCIFTWQSSSRWGDVLRMSQSRRLHDDFQQLVLMVGLYHDFYVAEITHFQGKRPPMPGVPEARSSADEKLQQNLFLNQWLREGLELTRPELLPSK